MVESQVGFVEIFVLLHDDMQPIITVTSKQQHVYIVRCSRSVSCAPRVEVLCLCVFVLSVLEEKRDEWGTADLDWTGFLWNDMAKKNMKNGGAGERLTPAFGDKPSFYPLYLPGSVCAC